MPHEKHRKLADHFNDTYSGYNYIYNKARTNLLIIKAGTIPKSLNKYIDEIRECLALWKYLAATTLLRTTLEISVQDLCQKNKLDDLGNSNYLNDKYDFWMEMLDKEKIDSLDNVSLKSISLMHQIDLFCSINKFSSHQEECHDLRKKSNKIVHNEIELDKKLAMNIGHRTFQLIHELYEAN